MSSVGAAERAKQIDRKAYLSHSSRLEASKRHSMNWDFDLPNIKQANCMRVLIVDDDSAMAELTAECLMMDPAVLVRTSGDGASALRAAAEFEPEVVLLDVELPDVSGLELAPQLKARGSRVVPRIIIFSGSVQEADFKFLPDGVEAWLTKPAQLDALLDRIFRPTASKNGCSDRISHHVLKGVLRSPP